MNIDKRTKKIIFFWLIFNCIGYLSYLTKITPYSKTIIEEGYPNWSTSKVSNYTFFLTPDYNRFKKCDTWFDYAKTDVANLEDNFWPFHSWHYECGVHNRIDDSTTYNNNIDYVTVGFPGIFGYYNHDEFLFYVILPLLIFSLYLLYNKFIK